MTPDKPENPQQGKAGDTSPEDAAAAKANVEETPAQPEPSTPETDAEPQAEGTAAAETGVDKEAAEATEEKPKPKRSRAKKTEEPVAEQKPAKQSGRKRDRRPAAQPGVQVHAKARYVRTSARKARLVCDHIRGKDVAEARAILAFTPRAAAKPWLKLLESAVANAEHNHELVGEELKIAAVHADEGPTLKRFRPRAMGRATRIRKRTSHLSITLTPKES